MDDNGAFAAELDQAAVAGAEGTAWGIHDFPESNLNITCYSSLPFEYSSKPELVIFDLCGDSATTNPAKPSTLPPTSPTTEQTIGVGNPNPNASGIGTGTSSICSLDSLRGKEKDHASTMADLKGTTAARSRKMTDEERRIMLHKRRLRNRASAARSREKRSRTLNDLSRDVEELMKRSSRLEEVVEKVKEESRLLRARNGVLSKENELLKKELKI